MRTPYFGALSLVCLNWEARGTRGSVAMAAVAVLRNETLQAFLQVREKFDMLLKMFFDLFVAGSVKSSLSVRILQ